MNHAQQLIFLAEQIAQYAEQAGRFDRAAAAAARAAGADAAGATSLATLRDEARVMLAACTDQHTAILNELQRDYPEIW